MSASSKISSSCSSNMMPSPSSCKQKLITQNYNEFSIGTSFMRDPWNCDVITVQIYSSKQNFLHMLQKVEWTKTQQAEREADNFVSSLSAVLTCLVKSKFFIIIKQKRKSYIWYIPCTFHVFDIAKFEKQNENIRWRIMEILKGAMFLWSVHSFAQIEVPESF